MGLMTSYIHWLAGLLEGEGCFYFHRHQALVQLKMTDLDVVQRVANLFGSPVHEDRSSSRRNPKHSICFSTTTNSGAGWMMMLYPLLGIRRREKIHRVLDSWRKIAAAPKYRTLCAQGHPYTFRLKNGWRKCRTCETKIGRAHV